MGSLLVKVFGFRASRPLAFEICVAVIVVYGSGIFFGFTVTQFTSKSKVPPRVSYT